MKIVNLSFNSVFAQREYRESTSSEVRYCQVLDHYESALEVELDNHTFTAQRTLYQQSVSVEDIKTLSRTLKKDVSSQVEGYVFRQGLGAIEVTHPDLIGFPTKYACCVVVEGNNCEAFFHVTESFRLSAQEELLLRVEYQLKQQIMNQIRAKLFEGWKI